MSSLLYLYLVKKGFSQGDGRSVNYGEIYALDIYFSLLLFHYHDVYIYLYPCIRSSIHHLTPNPKPITITITIIINSICHQKLNPPILLLHPLLASRPPSPTCTAAVVLGLLIVGIGVTVLIPGPAFALALVLATAVVDSGIALPLNPKPAGKVPKVIPPLPVALPPTTVVGLNFSVIVLPAATTTTLDPSPASEIISPFFNVTAGPPGTTVFPESGKMIALLLVGFRM